MSYLQCRIYSFEQQFFLQTFSPFAAERAISLANDGPLTYKTFNSADEDFVFAYLQNNLCVSVLCILRHN